MRFRFIGNGDNDPAEVTLGGVTFPKGEPVEAPEGWEDRLRGNAHFQVVRGRPRAKDQP